MVAPVQYRAPTPKVRWTRSRPVEVDVVGVPELPVIAIGAADDGDDAVPLADRLAGDLGIAGRDPDPELNGAPHPKDLVNEDGKRLRPAPKSGSQRSSTASIYAAFAIALAIAETRTK